MRCWNHDCNNELSRHAATCPACGTDRPQSAGSTTGPRVTITVAGRDISCPQCEAPDCRQPGTMSESTLGTGPWWCHQHFPPFRFARAARAKRATEPRQPDFEAIAERIAIGTEPTR